MSPAALLLLSLAGQFEAPQAYTIEELELRFGIEVVVENARFPVATTNGPIRGTDASTEDCERFSVLLGEELGLYPPQFVQRARLRRIVLCRDLTKGGAVNPAVVHHEHATLYFDVEITREDRRYMRRSFHHELFHFYDWADDGKVDVDEVWSALNPPEFRYFVGGGAVQLDQSMGLWTEEFGGFLSRYGRTALPEDKAELWSFALVHPREVAARARVDSLLAAKLERMRLRMRAFAPAIDDAFWNGLQLLERPEPHRLDNRSPR